MVVIYRIHHGPTRSYRVSDDVNPYYLKAPNVIRDHLDDIVSPLDGTPQTSKRAYYQSLRKAGCEVNPEATIRDQNRPEHDTRELKAEIARALRDLKGQ
jgi:hypothetical protein